MLSYLAAHALVRQFFIASDALQAFDSVPALVDFLCDRIRTASQGNDEWQRCARALHELLRSPDFQPTDGSPIHRSLTRLLEVLPQRFSKSLARETGWAFTLVVDVLGKLPQSDVTNVAANTAAMWWTSSEAQDAVEDVLKVAIVAALELTLLRPELREQLREKVSSLAELSKKPNLQAAVLELLAILCYDSAEAQEAMTPVTEQLLGPLLKPDLRHLGAAFRKTRSDEQPPATTLSLPPLLQKFSSNNRQKQASFKVSAALKLLERLAYIVPAGTSTLDDASSTVNASDELFDAASRWNGQGSFAEASGQLCWRVRNIGERTSQLTNSLDSVLDALNHATIEQPSASPATATGSSGNLFVLRPGLRALANILYANPPAQQYVKAGDGLQVVQNVLELMKRSESTRDHEWTRIVVACSDVVGNLLFGDALAQGSETVSRIVSTLLQLLSQLSLKDGAVVVKNVCVSTLLSATARVRLLGRSSLANLRNWLHRRAHVAPKQEATTAASSLSLVLLATLKDAAQERDWLTEWVMAASASLDVFVASAPLQGDRDIVVTDALMRGCEAQLSQEQCKPLFPKFVRSRWVPPSPPPSVVGLEGQNDAHDDDDDATEIRRSAGSILHELSSEALRVMDELCRSGLKATLAAPFARNLCEGDWYERETRGFHVSRFVQTSVEADSSPVLSSDMEAARAAVVPDLDAMGIAVETLAQAFREVRLATPLLQADLAEWLSASLASSPSLLLREGVFNTIELYGNSRAPVAAPLLGSGATNTWLPLTIPSSEGRETLNVSGYNYDGSLRDFQRYWAGHPLAELFDRLGGDTGPDCEELWYHATTQTNAASILHGRFDLNECRSGLTFSREQAAYFNPSYRDAIVYSSDTHLQPSPALLIYRATRAQMAAVGEVRVLADGREWSDYIRLVFPRTRRPLPSFVAPPFVIGAQLQNRLRLAREEPTPRTDGGMIQHLLAITTDAAMDFFERKLVAVMYLGYR
ncbi:hypothetical protein CAOG_05897 [Capsaspora owczarzaki ATCC 30864]|nr:hypothetical protein CAOG_05897 [Capsaspora owczarzaki ATCC 30864]|eukprot:XP_004345487.1 hypothetical protein CAOG_05897 [Capsaspora owczarzaki ATCC 30864]